MGYSCGILVAFLSLLLTGCASHAALIRALANDPATACVTVTTIYGTMRLSRTAIPAGKVTCTQEGMTVESSH